jgi:starch synthase
LLADPARRAAMGAAGRERVEQWYTWPGVAAQTEVVYQRLRLRSGSGPETLTTEGSLTAGAS